jgi:hypothetical protein
MNKGSPVAQWEDVIIAVIPNSRESNMTGIFSPPYQNAAAHPSLGKNLNKELWGKTGMGILKAQNKEGQERYGTSEGQIGILPDKPLKVGRKRVYREARLEEIQE